MKLVSIDGSMGEGGGQILRTSVSLAAVLGLPIRVYNIRAKRKNPGLRPQHLNAIRAIAEISGGRLVGAEIGSTVIEFYPGEIRGGRYVINIGTAGSVTLVLQALIPVMGFAPSRISVRIMGGTDVPMSPTIDYFREVFTPLLERCGLRVEISLLRRGHYPRGGGIVEAKVEEPPGSLKPVNLEERGSLLEIRGRSHAVRLPSHVASRQALSARGILERELGREALIEEEWYAPGRDPHLGPGSGITLWAVFSNSIMGSDALGERGKPAERVGEEAARKLVEDVRTGTSLDRHASDMLPLYAALARGESRLTGSRLTMHAITVFKLLELIMEGFEYNIEGSQNEPFRAVIRGAGIQR
ncbi:MAG: RNA 3'-terminal phosphate cyclase [Desulfurococcales archaeon]|nr:RNA 3'-terminal phosphate cyclase [Desulfurococcales archaeon]